MATKAYLLHFSYKLLYFAEVIIYAKWNWVNIYAPLVVSLGYPGDTNKTVLINHVRT